MINLELNPEIFREYDIRGVVDKDLTEEVMEFIGKAYGTLIAKKGSETVVCGHDNRESSERLQRALINGLVSAGCNVIDIGLSSSPMMYYAVHKLNAAAGMNVTGSHNPKEFNGVKITREKALPVYGEEIQKIRDIIEKGQFKLGKGKVEKGKILQDYFKMLREKISLKKKVKVVVDCGNGTAGIIAPKIFKDWGCEVVELYCELDGSFPNHLPDPVKPEFLQDLIKKVKEEKADLGIGLDGDVDRIGVVDSEGNIIWGDTLMILFAMEILQKNPGAKILFEVKCSQALYEEIEKNGGKPIIWKTGHSLIKAKMREENALLAGEMSGHMFFADEYFGFDDAVYAAGRLLRILSESEKSIKELLENIPKYFSTPEIRLDCSDTEKERIVNEVKEYFLEKYPDSVTVDGIRIIMPNGWALVRKSNTQPKIIVRFEAKTEERLEEIKKEVMEKLAEYPAVKLNYIKGHK